MTDGGSLAIPRRVSGEGWLVLLGGGEFSFEETEAADAAWLGKGEGDVGFLPAASGSEDYAAHFAVYLDEYFGRRVQTLPIYRARDARRGKNAERLDGVPNVYVGGGVADQLLDALADTPCAESLARKLANGGTVAAIAAGAQALGEAVRSLRGGKLLAGLGWLPEGVVETNFEGKEGGASDRRLRQLLGHPEARWGLAIAAGGAVLLGPAGEVEVVGTAYAVDGAQGELRRLPPTEALEHSPGDVVAEPRFEDE